MALSVAVAARWISPVLPRRASKRTTNNCCAGERDAAYIRRAAEISDKSAGLSAPHANYGCVVVSAAGRIAGEGFLYAQGAQPAEVQAVDASGDSAKGATAYVNMEPVDCPGGHASVSALVEAGVSRVVVGIRNPLQHVEGNAIRALRGHHLQVDVIGENQQSKAIEDARKMCLAINAPLFYRASHRVPFSILKYAMTLDGKIASSSGHSAWISSKESRNLVSQLRGRSDVVVIGGNTVRRDNPLLTVRHGGAHGAIRAVMTRTLDLPERANLWDVSGAPTLVLTQKGARVSFQNFLASKGVDVVEFEFLSPKNVMEYFYDHGYLSILWECGGSLAASAISSRVIHKVFAFVAPKIIGGTHAPSPVGELGLAQMSQALDLIDFSYEKIGPDLLVAGFLVPIPDPGCVTMANPSMKII